MDQENTIPTNPVPKAKKNTGLKIALICTSILSVASIGFGIFSFIQNNQKDQEIKDLKANTTGATTINCTTTASESNSAENIKNNFAFDASKIINREDNHHYIGGTTQDGSYLSITPFSEPSTTISIYLNYSEINRIFNTNFTSANSNHEIHFTKKVADTYFANLSSQSPGYEVLLFLMEDQTVEYIPLGKMVTENRFESVGTLPDVNNVVKFFSGDRCGNGLGACMHTTYVITENGQIFDLYPIIEATGAFKGKF